LTRDTSRGFECIEFAEQVLGLELMPWQKWLLIHGLELAEDDTFRFRTLLLLCARQNGKTTLMQLLALWRIYVDRAPLVIGSAQNLPMAEETWDGALSMAEGVPELAAELAHISRVNGDKFMRLTSGERYKVATASRRGGRGLSSDLVLLDELREHQSWDAWGAITKTTMARPSPQTLGFSNAGDAQSIVLAELRAKALASAADPTTTLGIFEWSAPDGCPMDDPDGWTAANPALGHRMSEHAIRSALATDPEDVFRTEVLCQWVTSVDSAIPGEVWRTLADPATEHGRFPIFALDVAPDQSTASIAVAWKRTDGVAYVDLTDHREGVDWIVARAAQLKQRYNGKLIVEKTGTAGFLIPALEAAGIRLELVARHFYADACSALDAAISGLQMRHSNHPDLNQAVAAARWYAGGETGHRIIVRKDPRVSALVASSLAMHGVGTVKRPGHFLILS
jgi:phage terminase large subunit-like protein